jgi:hypothetical protein
MEAFVGLPPFFFLICFFLICFFLICFAPFRSFCILKLLNRVKGVEWL